MAEDTSSQEERDRLVAEALAHAEARDQLYRPPTEIVPSGRWRGALGLVLLVLSAVLAAAPPSWLQGAPRPSVSAQERALGVRVALELQAEQIEAYRQRNQRLPTDLGQVPAALPGIRFVRSDNRLYQLVAYGPDRQAVVLESTRPDPGTREAASVFLARVDGS